MPDSVKDFLQIEPLLDCPVEIGRALWMLEDARRRTQKALQGFNAAWVDRSPEPGDHTVGTLLYHIAAIELDWLYSDVLQTDWAEPLVSLFTRDVRDQNGKLTAVVGEAYDAHWSRLAVVRSHLLTTFRGMTLDDFYRPRHLPRYDVTLEWVLHHLCQHEAEHRGELAYLSAWAARTEERDR